MRTALAVGLAVAAIVGAAGTPGAVSATSSSVALQTHSADQSPERYVLPLPGTVASLLVNRFEAPLTRYAAGHRGVDLSASPPVNVAAPNSGVVTFNGRVAGRSLIVIAHADGLRSTLEPVISNLTVGDAIARGQSVGHVDVGHDCRGPATCLHWGVRTSSGDYVDPLLLLGTFVVRLYPV